MEKVNKRGRKKKEADYNNRFSVRLRKLINETGVTQQEISEKISASRQALNKWVNGETIPDIFSAAEIADFFGVSIDYLMDRGKIKSSDEDIVITCNVTGLSEDAVTELITNKTLSSNQLSKIMEKSEFWNIIRVFARAQSDVKSYYPNSEETINAVVGSLFCPEIPYKYKKAFEFISINGTHQLYKNELSSLITELLDKIVKEEIKNGEHNSQKE